MKQIPAIINNEYYYSLDKTSIKSISGDTVAEITSFPVIRLHQIQRNFEEKFFEMQKIPVLEILNILKESAEEFKKMNFNIGEDTYNKNDYINMTSSSTGLPAKFIEKEIDEIADIIYNLETILSIQNPGDDLTNAFDLHKYYKDNQKIGYYPAGKSLLIKVPGNVPTICLYWLIPFVMKRPIILVPPNEDSLTHLLLVEAIKKVNPKLGSFITFLPCGDNVLQQLIGKVDQVMISESSKNMILNTPDGLEKTYFIHYGRTKFLIDNSYSAEHVQSIVRRMMWNSGRTCTGLTSVVIKGNALSLSEKIVSELQSKIYNDFEKNKENLPLFSKNKAEIINDSINSFIDSGEVIDMTSSINNGSRMISKDNKAMILPTVLLVKDKKSKAFGLELPFPFITVLEAENNNEVIDYTKNTLILSVISDNKELIKTLSYEKSILKIFSGEYIERGYNYLDPHEGYMIDFLYNKKAVF